MPSLKGQSIGGLLDPQLTNLTLNQRRTMQNLVAQGIAPNVARNLAIALTKSAAVPVQKKSYHQAFSEAAKEILPDGLTSRLHLRARAIAGGYAKKAKRMSEEEVVDAVKAEGMTPPKGVQAACKRGLELAPEHGGDGLTDGAKARARAMAAGSPVSPEQLRRMASFFARHSSYEKETSPPSPGYVSWLLWGGDAGRSWAESKKDSVQKAEFNESDHPRDEKGQFAEGGGGGSAPSLKEQSDAHYAEAQKRKAAGDRQGYLESMRAGNAALNAHVKEIKAKTTAIRAESRSIASKLRQQEDKKPEMTASESKQRPTGDAPAAEPASKPTAPSESKSFSSGGGENVAGRTVQSVGMQSNYGVGGHIGTDASKNAYQHLDDARDFIKQADEHANAGRFKEAAEHYVKATNSAYAARDKARPFSNHTTGKSRRASKEAIAEQKAYEQKMYAHRVGAASAQQAGDAAKSFLHFSAGSAHAILGNTIKEVSQARLPNLSLVKAQSALRIAKSGQKPMGAAFAHARASGKKQDHKSRKRRANKWLEENGHEKIGKMAPNAADVRAEQFLKLVQDRKKKRSKTVAKSEKIAVSVPCRIVKAEQQDWQRLVWSVVYEPDTIDLHGDFMDADTIQKAAHDAMRSGIYINSEHRGDPLDAEVVESYTAPCNFTLSTSDGDVTVTKGSWVQCLHVKDDAHWAGVLDGTYTGFSLEGMALAHPLN